MMWYWGPSYGWPITLVGIVSMFLCWAGIFVVVVLLARWLGAWRGTSTDPALETLRRRLAAGEITSEEFEKVRRILGG
jgi:putative membrane protein